MQICINMGLTKEQLFDFVKVIKLNVGEEEAHKSKSILAKL
jgi:hypothetical protein